MKKQFTLIRSLILFALLAIGNTFAFGAKYLLVTDATTLKQGDKVIIAGKNAQGAAFALDAANSNNRASLAITILADNSIEYTGAHALVLGGGTEGWTFYDETNTAYLNNGSSTSSNHLQTKEVLDKYAYFTIEIKANNSAAITGTGKATRNLMRLNSSNNPPIFACYTSGQADIFLYKIEATADPVINAPKAADFGNVDINVSATKTITVTAANLTGTQISASITGDKFTLTPATLPLEGGELEITVLSDAEGVCNGTLTLTDGTTTATVTLTANIIDPVKFTVATIAELKAKGTTDETSIYTLTGDLTVLHQDGQNLFVKDATEAMLIYGNMITKVYAMGDVITGGLKGTNKLYSGMFEFIPTTDMADKSSSIEVTPIELTIAQLNGNYDDYESQLVAIKDITFEGSTFTSKNINAVSGTDKLVCRNQFNNITTPLPATAHIKGLVGRFNTTVQLYFRNNDDIESLVNVSDITASDNIFASNGVLNINLSSIQNITVYNIQGQALIQTTGKEGWNQINLSNKGIVVVKVGNEMTKVML